MRNLFLCLLVLMSIEGFTQPSSRSYFKLDEEFDHSKDSLNVRIWVSGHYIQGIFYDFKLSRENKLELRSGYLIPAMDSLFFVKVNCDRTPTDIWKELISNDIHLLPNQEDIEIIIHNNGNSFPMSKEIKQKLFDRLNGSYFSVEICSRESYREYSFLDSDSFYKSIEEEIYSSDEFEKMHQIARIVFSDLDFKTVRNDLFRKVLSKQ